MKKNLCLFFIRHSKLLLPYKNHSAMPIKIIVDLALNKLNPPIDPAISKILIKRAKMYIPFCKITKIYSSPSKRCASTASFIKDFIKINCSYKIPIILKKELREVCFELNKIIGREKRIINISIINDRVFYAMNDSKYCEPMPKIIKRINGLFNYFSDNHSNSDKFLIITHDFLMRVIEIYIKNKGIIKNKITYEELKKTKRNNYLKGFATDFKLSFFIRF